jgi:uncharacterized membrane protein
LLEERWQNVALPWAKRVSGRGRPRIQVPYTTVTLILEIGALLGLVAIWVYTVVSWGHLPGRFPTHFAANGQPDTFGGKGALLTFPLLATFLYGGLSFLRLRPWAFNYPYPLTAENTERQYSMAVVLLSCFKVEMIAVVGYIQWQTVQIGNGINGGLGRLLLPLTIMLVLGTLIVYLVVAHKAFVTRETY